MQSIKHLPELAKALEPYMLKKTGRAGSTVGAVSVTATTVIDDTTTANSYTYPNDGSVPADVTIGKYSLSTSDTAFLLYSCKNGIWFGEKAAGASAFTYSGFHNSQNDVALLAWKTVEDQDAETITAISHEDTLTLSQTMMIGTASNHIDTGEIGLAGVFTDVGGTGNTITAHLQGVICCDGDSSAPSRGVVMAGTDLTASGRSVALGGSNNTATGTRSASIGGFNKDVTGTDSASIGGEETDVSGTRSATIGGRYVTVVGNGSAAIACRNFDVDGALSIALVADDGYCDGDQSLVFGRRINVANTVSGVVVLADTDGTTLSPSTDDEMTCAFQGGFRFFTNGDRDAGAVLAADATSWTSTSSRKIKQNIEPVDYADVLSRFDRFDVNTYEFINGDDTVYAGPIAEDWHVAFSGVVSPQFTGELPAINSGNMAAISLAGVKALREENKALRATVADLVARVEALEGK